MQTMELFKKICKIPHCSGKTEKLRDFIEEFCLKVGCEVVIDTVGNILAKKGFPGVCLQAHYDMVCVGKAPNINIQEEDGYIKAKESTLGADNGIGIALMLEAAKISNNIELLFTNDEEIGMIGAKNLNLKIISKKILNLDTEEEGKVYIGCAGGVDVKVNKKINKAKVDNEEIYEIIVSDLPGGHSGVDIDKKIPNAIKELGWYLSKFDPKIISLEGGEAINAIPKYAKAIVALDIADILPIQKNIKVAKLPKDNDYWYIKESKMIVDIINGFANGVRGYDTAFSLPSKSVNLSRIKIVDDMLTLELFPRANSNKELEELKSEISSYFRLSGCDIEFSNQFGAWKPDVNEFSKEICEIVKETFGRCEYSAIHAGLECGVLLEHLGEDKLVASIGPNIYNPHSTNERCEIESIFRLEKIIKKLVR